MNPQRPAKIIIEDVDVGYGDRIVLQGINAQIYQGEIFVIMGGSGCGKSTLLRTLIGLQPPKKGRILYDGVPQEQWLGTAESTARRIGVLFQAGALWTSMTLFENVALPLEVYTPLSSQEIERIVRFKLALVGLTGFEEFYPEQLSGGMQKRAALARAIALDPEILFLDEPSAGLDPVTSRNLDRLIVELRNVLGSTFVIVTHELESVFNIADRAMFLDAKTKTVRAIATPCELFRQSGDQVIREFFAQGAWSEEIVAKLCEKTASGAKIKPV